VVIRLLVEPAIFDLHERPVDNRMPRKKDQHLMEQNLNSLGLIRLDELTKHRDHDVGELFATSQFMEYSTCIPFCFKL